jgi:hypothetical protein
MTNYIARDENNVLTVTNDNEAKKQLLALATAGYTIYSITPVGDGSFVLTPQVLSNEQYDQVLTDATFTDAP